MAYRIFGHGMQTLSWDMRKLVPWTALNLGPLHWEYKCLATGPPGKFLELFPTPLFLSHLCLVAQSCLTLCDPMDSSLPDSSVVGIFQARILEWVAISFSRGSSRPKDQTHVFYIGRQFLYHWATWEALIPTPQQHQRLQVSYIQDSGFLNIQFIFIMTYFEYQCKEQCHEDQCTHYPVLT